MSWLGTISGRRIDLIEPDPNEITIEDIAHGLAYTNRFGGHTEIAYSVAQHSVLASDYCRSHQIEALMHDAAEAYLGDCPRPLKQLLSDWPAIEQRIHSAICLKFGIPAAIPREVKAVDDRLLFTERRDLQPNPPPWGWDVEPYLAPIQPWAPEAAKKLFLRRFHELTGII